MDLTELRKPFPRHKVSWRAQQVSLKGEQAKALALAYIDARDVADRLDEVVGPENWQCRYEFSPDGKKTLCEIGIRCGTEWIWKADGAGDSDIEAEKGALSDAFKRAAVKWGVARYLYDLKSPWVPCEVFNNKWKRFTEDPWNYVRDEGSPSGKPAPRPQAPAPRENAPSAPRSAPQPAPERWDAPSPRKSIWSTDKAESGGDQKATQGSLLETPGQCPECHAPNGRHASKCSKAGGGNAMRSGL